MILVLANHYDAEAAWLRRALEERCRHPVLLLCPEGLGVDYSISLRLRNDGRHGCAISFFDDAARRWDGDRIRYAVNRLGFVEPLVWRSAAEAERIYATSEINAFFPALIQSLRCPVDSPVQHGALWVDGGFEVRWAVRLNACGVAVHPSMTGPPGKAFATLLEADPAALRRWMCFEGEVFTPAAQRGAHPRVAEHLRALAPGQTLEFVCLQGEDPAALQLLHVSRTPALSWYGRPFVEALLVHADGARHGHPDGNSERAALAAAC